MITLYGFGPLFGLREVSPYVTKTYLQLKLAGLPFRLETGNTGALGESPTATLPFIIDDDGQAVGDSVLIRFHLQEKYGVDLERGLTATQAAIAWAIERMCDDHLSAAITYTRWLDDDNFARGPIQFFELLPEPQRTEAITVTRNKARDRFRAQGLSVHAHKDVVKLLSSDIRSLAALIGDNTYFFGDEMTIADTVAYPFIAQVLCTQFDNDIRDFAERSPKLVAYAGRMAERFHAMLDEDAGAAADP